MKKYLSTILTCSVLFGLSACESEEQAMDAVRVPLKIRAELPSSGFTRSIPREDDGFSVYRFSNGDKAGFFSEGGNTGNDPYYNAEMTFKDGYFTVDDGSSADINRLGNTLLYYPYSAAENGRQPIRQTDGNYKDEVIDLLYSTTVGDIDHGLVASFNHTFSMFIIDGGLGFEKISSADEGERPEITVVMEKPLETVEFQRSDDEVGYKVVFNGGYTEGSQPDARFAKFKGHYNATDHKYYIIVPNDGVTRIKSINVTDDDGRMHKIKWPHYLEFGKKYPITLELDEMVPVVNLHPIQPWGENTELEANQEKGIGDPSTFMNWITAYNADSEGDLSKYGDKIEITDENGTQTGKSYWHFFLTSDIDLSELPDVSEVAHLITTLGDCFDGCGHTLSGITLKGDHAALIEVMDGEYARVENLTIDGLTIRTTGTTAVGALIQDFQQGTVRNCSLQNVLIEAESAAGVIAGAIGENTEDITIEKCNASGRIFAKETADKIIGSGTLTAEQKKGCDVSNVMFGKK